MTANLKTKMEKSSVHDATPTLEIANVSERTPLQTSLDFLTSLRAACLANLQAHSDKCAELLTSVGSGPKPSESCASFDRDSESLRTRQASLFSKADEPGTELCQDWSRAGMIAGGMYFPLPRLVQGISASASSSPLPTPVAADGKRGPDYARASRPGSGGDDLVTHLARMLPTPTARDYKDTPGMARTATDGRERDDQLPRRIYGDVSATSGTASLGGMRLTPEFLCWLMGYPPDWLKPLRDVPGTQSSRKLPKK